MNNLTGGASPEAPVSYCFASISLYCESYPSQS